MKNLTVTIENRAPAGYAGLRKAVAETLISGQRKLEALKVQIYWQTGKLISDYLERNPGDADYGNSVIERLAADLEIERTVLYRIGKFYRLFPNSATWHYLTWSHYRALLVIENAGSAQAVPLFQFCLWKKGKR